MVVMTFPGEIELFSASYTPRLIFQTAMRPLLPGSLHSGTGPENKAVMIAKLTSTLLINHAEFMYRRYRVKSITSSWC